MTTPVPQRNSTRQPFLDLKEWYRLGWLLPWIVLLLSFAATYTMWKNEWRNSHQNLQLDFDFRVRETHARIEDRLNTYEQILRGAGALFGASTSVAHSEFHTYYQSLHLDDHYSGSYGVGFAPVVLQKGRPGVSAPIGYLEPHAEFSRFHLGNDLYADPVLRVAMDAARDTGMAVNSGKVLLPRYADEDISTQSGFLMFLPVYGKGVPTGTVEQRRAGITGWVFIPFRAIDLFTGILGEIGSEIDIEIHDGSQIIDATMLYDPDVSGAGGNPEAKFRHVKRMQFENHFWTVVVISLPGFEMSADSRKPNFVAYVGFMMSLLLTILAWLLVQGRALALQSAARLNHELAERKRAEEGLLLAATVVKTVEEAVVVTDKENKIVAANPAFTAITGYAVEEVIGKNPRLLSSGRHTKEFFEEFWTTLLSTGSWHGEIWDRRKDGEIYIKWLSVKLVRDAEGKITHHVGVFSDITERKAAEERMKHLAHHDMLTNLPNRTLFSDRLQQGLAQAKRDKEHLALMFLDLDKFKPINDNFGHAVGDMLLKEVARRLQNCVRGSDTVSRIGGDEFVVLLPSIEAERHAMLVAEKMLHVLSQPFELAGQSLHISGSIGIAVYPEHGSDERALTHNADIAMYYAKSGGRNNARAYQPDMRDAGQ